MVAALLVVYVLWGSTSPAIKVAVAHITPFYMAAIRFAIAGGLLFAWGALRGVAAPTWRDWSWAAFSGVLMLALGNGVYGWTLQYIPAGIGSLFFALNPLWNASIGGAFYRERLSPVAIAGVLGGFAGMAYLISPGGVSLPLFPTIVGLATSLVWSIGTMLQRLYRGGDVMQMSAMQMIVAAPVLAAIGAASGARLHVTDFTPASIGAVAFLIVGGSIFGFSAFLWLARNVPTVLASTYAYVNPIVAIFIATVFLHEPLGWHTVIGGAIVLASVALMLAPSGRAPRVAGR